MTRPVSTSSGSAIIALFFTATLPASADPASRPGNSISVSAYPFLGDDQTDTDLAFSANFKFNDRLSYFGFLNIDSAMHDGDMDVGRSEHNVRFKITETSPLDLNLQALRAPGPNNDYAQLGVSLRANDVPLFRDFFDSMNVKYRLTVSPLRFGEHEPGGFGVEHVFIWFVPKTDRKLALKGFLDKGFGEDLPPIFPKNPIVSEIEASYNISAGFSLALQYRYNEKTPGRERNLAIGIEKSLEW